MLTKQHIYLIITLVSYAGMAELADAHGSGPCESNFMQVQVLLPAPRVSLIIVKLTLFFRR